MHLAPEPRPDWENPAVFEISRLPPRSASWPCPDLASALGGDYDNSPLVQSLNGDWLFHWSPTPEDQTSANQARGISRPVATCVIGFGDVRPGSTGLRTVVRVPWLAGFRRR